MSQIDNTIFDFFNKKINILTVDDEPVILDAVTGIFSSPLFNIAIGSTVREAFRIISKSEDPWHCWILDINIEKEGDGFDILKKYPNFPFAIMLSGLRSMTIASDAMKYGAIGVFDKDPASLDLLHDGVCKVASLGFILGGKGGQYLEHFQLLMTNHIKNPEEWANLACISIRQLERVCTIHSSLTPRFIISLYYTLYFSLTDGSPHSEGPVSDSDFYNSHIHFFNKHYEKYQEVLSEQPSFSM